MYLRGAGHFLLYLRTSALALISHHIIPIKANSLVATFARCRTYYSTLTFFENTVNT